MAVWDRNKVLPSAINNGREFTPNDDLAVEELNAMVNNSFYGVDFAEAMADTPMVDNSNPNAEPTVELVDNVKTVNGEQIVYKKFKFNNIKGEQGVGISSIEFVGYDSNNGSVYNITLDDDRIFPFTAPAGDISGADTVTIGGKWKVQVNANNELEWTYVG